MKNEISLSTERTSVSFTVKGFATIMQDLWVIFKTVAVMKLYELCNAGHISPDFLKSHFPCETVKMYVLRWSLKRHYKTGNHLIYPQTKYKTQYCNETTSPLICLL